MQTQRDVLLEELGQALHEHTWNSHRHFMSLSEKIGLTVPQVVVLEKLKERGEPCSMQELSELTLQSGAALTGVIDRLVKAGFVTRTPYLHDRRVVAVTLTEAGDERLKDLQNYLRASFATDMQGFSDTELQQFTLLLQKFLVVSDERARIMSHYGSSHPGHNKYGDNGKAASQALANKTHNGDGDQTHF